NNFSPIQLYWQNETTGFALQGGIYSSGTKIKKTNNSGASWVDVFNDTTIQINVISFPSTTTGYIGGKTLNPTILTAKFLKSTNTGNTWDSITVHGIREVNSINFLNNLTGYISGPRSFSNGPCLLRTTTGGLSWDSIFYSGNSVYFKNLQFFNFNTGYGYVGGTVQKTINAGVNWTGSNPYTEAGLNISDFSAYNTDNVVSCGNLGSLGKTTNGGLNWTSISSGFRNYLYGLKFFDANTGIAVSDLNDTRGVILRTTNSGSHWDTITIDARGIYGINIYNANTAYLSGTGKIFKTTNKGISFTVFNTVVNAEWSEVSFPDENTGYTVSKYHMVDKTTNGGINWINISPFGSPEFFTICFINGNTGFMAGSKILKTTNGGTSWDTINTPIQPYYYTNKISYINGILYSLGHRYYEGYHTGIILKSTDIGLTWAADSLENESNIFDISVPIPNVLYIIGTNKIFKSINSSGWIAYNIYTQAPWRNSISFVNKDTGFISTYYGGILKTTNGGGTQIEIIPMTNETPTEFNLSQNYPNPFNPTTKIEFSLPQRTMVTIKVYNILGQLIKTALNEFKEPGKYSVTFDGSSLASGVYFYSIETDMFTKTRKMILLK